MKTENLINALMAALVAAALSSCASTGSDSGPRFVRDLNGKGGVVLATQWR